jgi:hypothetical protein
LHTEGEGINLDEYNGKDKENIVDGKDEDKDNEEEDDDDNDDNNKMSRKPVPPAAGHAGPAPAPQQDAPREGL